MRPMIIGSCGSQVEHGLGVGLFPPGAGQFEPSLDNVPMAAFDLA